jgi:hypothetical protein
MDDNFYNIDTDNKLSILPNFTLSLENSKTLITKEVKKLENMIPVSFYPKIAKLYRFSLALAAGLHSNTNIL